MVKRVDGIHLPAFYFPPSLCKISLHTLRGIWSQEDKKVFVEDLK